MEATNASSGSTAFAFENGAGTTDGEEDAGMVTPPSKVQVCSREYLPLRKSGPFRFQEMRALCSDILVSRIKSGGSASVKMNFNRTACTLICIPSGMLMTTESIRAVRWLPGTDGDYYGTAQGGGTNYDGIVFKITTETVFSILY